jgi:hypothetical protein
LAALSSCRSTYGRPTGERSENSLNLKGTYVQQYMHRQMSRDLVPNYIA